MHDEIERDIATATALLAFLRERLAEDEQLAEATTEAKRPWPAAWRKFRHTGDPLVSARPFLVMHSDGSPMVGESMREVDANFIAHMDPARTLAEVGAKRELLWDIERQLTNFECLRMEIGIFWFMLMLKHLSMPYAQHPDYRPEWSPDYRHTTGP